MRARMEVDGFDDMDQRLGAIERLGTSRSAILPVMVETLEPVAEHARQIVSVRTGRLRSDITVSDRVADNDFDQGLAAYVGPTIDAFYAEDVEFGRPSSISASGREHDATRPHPFMRPAWDAEVRGLLGRLADGFTRLLQRAAGG